MITYNKELWVIRIMIPFRGEGKKMKVLPHES